MTTNARQLHASLTRDFLVSRRARTNPADVGLLVDPSSLRRVRGLRREEVAELASISTNYYIRIERGHAAGVSSQVVASLSSALCLTDAERVHLHQLLNHRSADGSARARAIRRRPVVRPAVADVVGSIVDLPCFVFDDSLNILASNDLGRVLYQPLFEAEDAETPNSARFTFLHESQARELWPDWESFADHAVAILRTAFGRRPDDEALLALIYELFASSEQFRTRWERHDVIRRTSGTKVVNSPVVGAMALPFEILMLANAPGLHVMVYAPRAGSPQRDALRLLGSWQARQPTPTNVARSGDSGVPPNSVGL